MLLYKSSTVLVIDAAFSFESSNIVVLYRLLNFKSPGSTIPALIKPLVFFAHLHGFLLFTKPHLSFIQLYRSRLALIKRMRKLAAEIPNISEPNLWSISNISPSMYIILCSLLKQSNIHAVQFILISSIVC